jgi:hypothetical protein
MSGSATTASAIRRPALGFGWLRQTWNDFFFEEQSPVPLALFRIVYGLLVMMTLLFLYPDWLAWYGRHAWISLATMQSMEPSRRINLFPILPQSDAWIRGFFWVALSSAAMLAAGFLTRVNSVMVFVCLASIQQRNLFMTHGGDTFLRLAGFFLIFAPAGAALSVDRLIRVRRGVESAVVRPRRLWAQRMIQIQLALLYFASFCWKLKGSGWLNGTTLFYIYHLDSLHRFLLPGWFFRPTILKLASWSALAIEFSLGVLIWIRGIRYYVLACGIALHLWLEYSLNIPLFQWDVLSAYILFVDPADLTRVWNWITRRADRIEEPARAPNFSD